MESLVTPLKIRCTSCGRRVLYATQRLSSVLIVCLFVCFIIAKLCLAAGVSKFRTTSTLCLPETNALPVLNLFATENQNKFPSPPKKRKVAAKPTLTD